MNIQGVIVNKETYIKRKMDMEKIKAADFKNMVTLVERIRRHLVRIV